MFHSSWNIPTPKKNPEVSMLTQGLRNRYDDFFEEETNERYLVSEENGDENEFASQATVLQSGETSETAGDGEGAGDETEPATSTVTRRTTGEMEEGQESEPLINMERSRVGDPARASLEDCRYWE
jgi:hypothetical protein